MKENPQFDKLDANIERLRKQKLKIALDLAMVLHCKYYANNSFKHLKKELDGNS